MSLSDEPGLPGLFLEWSVEPKSLIQIVSEDEFLPLVQEPSAFFFRIYNSFVSRLDKGKEISRKFYSNLIQEAEFLESFLDEFGARENKRWTFFTEYVACIRNLGITAFFIKHLLDRYPYYNLRESEEENERFIREAQKALKFLNRSILNLYQQVIESGQANGLAFNKEAVSAHEFADIEANRRLPRNISEDEVKNEEERITDLCDKIQKVCRMMEKVKVEPTEDLAELKKLIPSRIDEKRARGFKELVHSVQSDYDTYVKNTKIEQENTIVKNLRGYISMSLHLLEGVLWLCHFYERHEDDIRGGECKQRITEMVDKSILLGTILNFCFRYSLHFLRKANELSEEIAAKFVKILRVELPIPKPLGFHARPSTYISLIARQHGEDLFLIVDDEKFNCKSVMSLLQAGGAVADRGYQTVHFEGSKRVLDHIKILAKHNYCEDGVIPKKLSYLRELRNTA